MTINILKFRFFHIIALLFLAQTVFAQNEGPLDEMSSAEEIKLSNTTFDPLIKVGKALLDGDSVMYVELNRIYVYPKKVFKNKKAQQKYNRDVANVKKVLPIAKEVRQMVVETYEYLQTLPDKKARKEHMKYVEKSLKEEYGPRMRKLSFKQGKLLIKLVYRECNSSSYNLINAFMGPIRAGFWQAFAWAYGASLTKKYDPDDDDKEIEKIVLQVEAGQI